ncbi:tetratricopeptide repeat protein [Aestuariispira insulae]|uniref:Tetratricopeptide repeat protein n=1 Tax=Aestuariispira insulae TaxID=1461337 RepID=A0A3D9HJR4_9PROT|nr:tetratricopeptide repeat protein [Aestuariispira insulae]RED49694.1 tetratricopeptide repeat protein [Aestuariispira insulae]
MGQMMWRILRIYLPALMIVACLGSGAAADQNDQRLPPLFAELKARISLAQAKLLEAQIWSIWGNHGREDVERLMQRGIQAMGSGQLVNAIDLFQEIIRIDPDYAEAWNKLATVRYMLGEFEQSVEDVDRTLDLEPRHFGALAGLGMNFEALGNAKAAINAYRRALEVNPYLFSVRKRLKVLEDGLPEDAT